MSRRAMPSVNASLIREMRMIAQQVFGSGRVDNYYAMEAARAQAKATKAAPALKCIFCLSVRPRSMQKDAVAIQNGQSVCEDHSFYADAPDFKAGLAKLINSEVKPI